MASEATLEETFLIHKFEPRKLKDRDKLVKILLFIFASLATIFVFLIILFLFTSGISFFGEVPLTDFLFGTNWYPSAGFFGAAPIIVGTFLVTFGAIIIAVPLGLATAIFIAEIAPPKVRKILKLSVEILAGIPSIVYGFFGIMFLNRFLRDLFGLSHGNMWLSGSLILAVMSLPTIVSVCEDAIRAVPNLYRDASYAMGATKWQTIRKVIIPAAISGITAAIILGMGRALGETMAMMLVIGNCKIFPEPITNMFSCIAVITSTIGLGFGPTEKASIEQRSLIALGIVLFIITLFINTLSNIILARIKRKFTGETKKNRLKKFEEVVFFKKIKILYQRYKKYVVRSIILVFIGWVLSTWIGLFYSLLICLGLIGAIYGIKRLSTMNQQKFWHTIILICSIFSVFMVGIIISYIVINGLPAFLKPGFLTDYPRDAGREGGILPAIVGTLQLTLGSIVFALVFGIPAGIYLSEYAKENRITKIIRAGIDNLNGTPSIVFALFGVVFFVYPLTIAFGWGRSLLAGILTLGLMILPTIIRTTEEAVKAIPQSFREGSLAIGSSKWQGISKIVIPAAIPGIVTGSVLSMGRSAGETAPIMFTASLASSRFISFSLTEPVMALTYHLYRLSGDVAGTLENAAGTALALLLIVLILYGIAFIVRNRYEKKKQW